MTYHFPQSFSGAPRCQGDARAAHQKPANLWMQDLLRRLGLAAKEGIEQVDEHLDGVGDIAILGHRHAKVPVGGIGRVDGEILPGIGPLEDILVLQGEEGEAQALAGQAVGGFVAGGGEGHLRGNPRPPKDVVANLPDALPRVHQHKGAALHMGQVQHRQGAFRVLPGQAHQPGAGGSGQNKGAAGDGVEADGALFLLGAVGKAVHHRKVQAPGGQLLFQLGGAFFHQLDGNVGVLPAEFRQHLGQQPGGQVGGHANGNPAGAEVFHLPNLLLEVVVDVQNLGGNAVVPLPHIGDGQPGGAADEELGAHLVLDALEAVAQGGLGDIELMGRPGDASLVGDGFYKNQISFGHSLSLLSFCYSGSLQRSTQPRASLAFSSSSQVRRTALLAVPQAG